MRDARERYSPGDWNVIDQQSGFRKKASEVRRQWDGLIVDKDHWESRHPQDFVRAKRDRQAVHNPRPELTDKFVGTFTDPIAPDFLDILITQDGERFITQTSVGESVDYLVTQ